MKLKKIVQLPDAGRTCRVVKVFWNDETEEFVCQLFISGGHYEPADYFTNDYGDALGTAAHMCLSQAGQMLFNLKNNLGYDSAKMLDALRRQGLKANECGDITHWRFADNSFLYYNADKNGWTT